MHSLHGMKRLVFKKLHLHVHIFVIFFIYFQKLALFQTDSKGVYFVLINLLIETIQGTCRFSLKIVTGDEQKTVTYCI